MPFFWAMCAIIFTALEFLFCDNSQRGDSGTHLWVEGTSTRRLPPSSPDVKP